MKRFTRVSILAAAVALLCPAVALGTTSDNFTIAIGGLPSPIQGAVSFNAGGCVITGGQLTCPPNVNYSDENDDYDAGDLVIVYTPSPLNAKIGMWADKAMNTGGSGGTLRREIVIQHLDGNDNVVATIEVFGCYPKNHVASGANMVLTLNVDRYELSGSYVTDSSLSPPAPPTPTATPASLSVEITTSKTALTSTYKSSARIQVGYKAQKNEFQKHEKQKAVIESTEGRWGTRIVYTLEVTNSGDTNAKKVTLKFALPSGSRFVSASGAHKHSESNNTVTWNFDSVNGKSSKTVTATVEIGSK